MTDMSPTEPRAPRTPVAYLRWMSGEVGPSGLKPVLILLAIASFERFGITAIGILGPNIRDTFHISNQTLITVVALTSIFPALFSPGIGFLSDRVDRVRLDQFATVVNGLAARARASEAAVFRAAPLLTPRRRLDETWAARKPVLRWRPVPPQQEAAE